MNHLYNSATIKYALVFILLMIAAAANASLLDCTKSPSVALAAGIECAPAKSLLNDGQSYAVKEALPAPPITAGLAGFQVDQTRTPSALPESAPLLILVGALLAVVLVRAKNCNTK